jgi:hypothetical protein
MNRETVIAKLREHEAELKILGVTADVPDKKMLPPEVLERSQRELILVF